MKTKLKDIILYSLAIVGAVSLFINATKEPQTIHQWKIETQDTAGGKCFLYNTYNGRVYLINNKNYTELFGK